MLLKIENRRETILHPLRYPNPHTHAHTHTHTNTHTHTHNQLDRPQNVDTIYIIRFVNMCIVSFRPC